MSIFTIGSGARQRAKVQQARARQRLEARKKREQESLEHHRLEMRVRELERDNAELLDAAKGLVELSRWIGEDQEFVRQLPFGTGAVIDETELAIARAQAVITKAEGK